MNNPLNDLEKITEYICKHQIKHPIRKECLECRDMPYDDLCPDYKAYKHVYWVEKEKA